MKIFPRHLPLFCLAVWLLCAAGVARAQSWDTNTIRFTAPTTCTTGQAISACAVTLYRIERAASATGTYAQVGTATASPFVHTGAAEGINCYRVTALSANGPSAPSTPPACRTNVRPVGPPNPPTDVVVVETIAYDVRPNESTFAFDRGRAVGTAKLGAACDESRAIADGFYALERPSKVTLHRAPRSTALVAKCAQASARSHAIAAVSGWFGYGRAYLVR